MDIIPIVSLLILICFFGCFCLIFSILKSVRWRILEVEYKLAKLYEHITF